MKSSKTKYLFWAILFITAWGVAIYKHIYPTARIICFCIGVSFLVIYLAYKISRYSLYRYEIQKIDRMSGERFEEYLKACFEIKGYNVELTNKSHDYGADLVCTNRKEKLIVQAKRYNGKVGNSAIQEIVAAKAFYKADKCMVATNSFFTPSAIKLAKANDVELWDRNNILSMSKGIRR